MYIRNISILQFYNLKEKVSVNEINCPGVQEMYNITAPSTRDEKLPRKLKKKSAL